MAHLLTRKCIETAFLGVESYLIENQLNYFKGIKSNNPLSILIGEKSRFIRLKLQVKGAFHLDSIQVLDKNGVDISLDGVTISSSSFNDVEMYDGRGFLNRKGNGGCGFHTKNENNPWLVLDLKKIHYIEKVIVNNRDDAFYKRALSLKIDTSSDLSSWRECYDNWQVLKSYKNGSISDVERALLYAVSFEASHAKTVIKALKGNGQHQEALLLLERINKLVRDKGLALGPHGFTETFDLASDEKKSKVYYELAMLLNWLNEEYGVPAFVSSGTLLGIVRDGQFIGHDDDLDICYISKESEPAKVLEDRKKLTRFLELKGCKVTQSDVAHLWCRTPGGISLDIFTGFLEGECCSMNPISRNEIKSEMVLPIKKQLVNNATLYLPADPEPLLAVNYGENWRVPDPLWTFDWSKARRDFAFLYFEGKND